MFLYVFWILVWHKKRLSVVPDLLVHSLDLDDGKKRPAEHPQRSGPPGPNFFDQPLGGHFGGPRRSDQFENVRGPVHVPYGQVRRYKAFQGGPPPRDHLRRDRQPLPDEGFVTIFFEFSYPHSPRAF